MMAKGREIVRLRASCNACNESKVRCSQKKPTCARCHRIGFECIYGLSRRSHKDAPPISVSPSQRFSRSSSNDDNKINPSTTGASPGRLPWTHNPTALVGNYMSMSAGPPFIDPPQHQDGSPIAPAPADTIIHHTGLQPDFRSIGSPFSATMTHVPASSTDYARPWDMGSLCGGNSITTTTTASSDMAMSSRSPTSPMTESSSPTDGKCTCHTGTAELLARMRNDGGDDHRGHLFPDAQLSRLKHCIASSEASIRCPHTREDAEPLHLMVATTLIGHVINEFEILASTFPLPRSSAGEQPAGSRATGRSYNRASVPNEAPYSRTVSNANAPVDSVMRPRLSWGVLNLEDDEEEDLRQRLCLLAFRKLERLLGQLAQRLGNLYNAQAGLPSPSRHTAFITACEHTCFWLEKKAEGVKKLFLDGSLL